MSAQNVYVVVDRHNGLLSLGTDGVLWRPHKSAAAFKSRHAAKRAVDRSLQYSRTYNLNWKEADYIIECVRVEL